MHSDRRKFDAEDDRIMNVLGQFASLAYQTLATIDDLKLQMAARERAETELRELTHGLEAQVRIRTEELEHRNQQLAEAKARLAEEKLSLERSEAYLATASRERSSPWGGVGQPPLLVDELAGVAWRFDISVDWNGDIRFRLTSVSARDVNLQGETTPVCGTQITKLAVADRYDAKLEFPNVRVWQDRTANGAGQCRGVARRRLPQRSR